MYAEVGLTVWTAALAITNAANAAVDPPAAASSWDLFLQYGVLGLLVVGFVTGWIVPGYQAKQLLEENRRLTALVEGKVFPLLETTGQTFDKAASAMEKATAAFERSIDAPSRGAGS